MSDQPPQTDMWQASLNYVAFKRALLRVTSDNSVKLSLVERSLRPYARVEEHPIVQLAFFARRRDIGDCVRISLLDKLKKCERANAISTRIHKLLRIYDIAVCVDCDVIELRQAVQQAGKPDRSEWKEAV